MLWKKVKGVKAEEAMGSLSMMFGVIEGRGGVRFELF